MTISPHHFEQLAESLLRASEAVRAMHAEMQAGTAAKPPTSSAPADEKVVEETTPAAAQETAPPAGTPTAEQFSAKCADLVAKAGGRQGKLFQPDPLTGQSIIQALMAKYAPGGEGLAGVKPTDYVAFVRELQGHV